jgi:hypothetical protein
MQSPHAASGEIVIASRIGVMTKPHPLYKEPGSEAGNRRRTYRKMFRRELAPGSINVRRICPPICPQCSGELTIVAFLTEADPIKRILIYIG